MAEVGRLPEYDIVRELMNLPARECSLPTVDRPGERMAYLIGHRDARHAACEAALPFVAELERRRSGWVLSSERKPDRYVGVPISFVTPDGRGRVDFGHWDGEQWDGNWHSPQPDSEVSHWYELSPVPQTEPRP